MFDPFGAITGLLGMDASRKAGNQQADAAQNAQNYQIQMYNQMRGDLGPYRDSGANALNTLYSKVNAGPGSFTESPGYQWRLSQGVNALDRSASAKGRLMSGAQTKAVTRYGQDYGAGEYQNWLNQWYQSLQPYQNLATMGQNAATMTGQAGLNTGQVVGQNMLRQGEATAAGTLGQANALASMVPISGNSIVGGLFGAGGSNFNWGNVFSSGQQAQQPQQSGVNGLAGNAGLMSSLAAFL